MSRRATWGWAQVALSRVCATRLNRTRIGGETPTLEKVERVPESTGQDLSTAPDDSLTNAGEETSVADPMFDVESPGRPRALAEPEAAADRPNEVGAVVETASQPAGPSDRTPRFHRTAAHTHRISVQRRSPQTDRRRRALLYNRCSKARKAVHVTSKFADIDATGEEDAVNPDGPVEAIPGLRIYKDGIDCSRCVYVCHSMETIRRHFNLSNIQVDSLFLAFSWRCVWLVTDQKGLALIGRGHMSGV